MQNSRVGVQNSNVGVHNSIVCVHKNMVGVLVSFNLFSVSVNQFLFSVNQPVSGDCHLGISTSSPGLLVIEFASFQIQRRLARLCAKEVRRRRNVEKRICFYGIGYLCKPNIPYKTS